MIELAIMFCLASDGDRQCHRETFQALKFRTVAECVEDLNGRVIPDLTKIGVEVVAAGCAVREKSDRKNVSTRLTAW